MNKDDLEKTVSLEEALALYFQVKTGERTFLVSDRGMEKELAKLYDTLGKNTRRDIYKNIAKDMQRETDCYTYAKKPDLLIEVGCGSGLLTLELAEQTGMNIIGIDVSEDMLKLAEQNLQERRREKEKAAEEYQQKTGMRTKREQTYFEHCAFQRGTVYQLKEQWKLQAPKYLVCRNALHRFERAEEALAEMYETLAENGHIYIRDLRRDAPWKILLERIGNDRWKFLPLVEDYLRAIAGTFTTQEVEKMLQTTGIRNYEIRNGFYRGTTEPHTHEFAQETEFVCVIKK